MRILAVDDDTSVLQALLAALRQLPGHDLRAATSGDQAYQTAVAQGGVDLLVTDVVMDPMDGLSLRNALLEAFPNLRTIFISGYDLSDYAESIGETPILAKPLDLAVLLETVQGELAKVPEPAVAAPTVPVAVPVPVAAPRAVPTAAPRAVPAAAVPVAVPRATPVAPQAVSVPKAVPVAKAPTAPSAPALLARWPPRLPRPHRKPCRPPSPRPSPWLRQKRSRCHEPCPSPRPRRLQRRPSHRRPPRPRRMPSACSARPSAATRSSRCLARDAGVPSSPACKSRSIAASA